MAPLSSIYKFTMYREPNVIGRLIENTRTVDIRDIYDYEVKANSNGFNRIWPFDSIIHQYCEYWLNILSHRHQNNFYILNHSNPNLVNFVKIRFEYLISYLELLNNVETLTMEDFIEFYRIINLFYNSIDDEQKKFNSVLPGIRVTLGRVKSSYRSNHPIRRLRRWSFDSRRWVVYREGLDGRYDERFVRGPL